MIPHRDFSQSVTPSSPIVFEPSKEITTPALKGCIELTQGSLEMLKPKYSFVCNGIKLLNRDSEGGYCKGLSQAFGFLFLAASPVLETARIVGGAAGTLAGAVGTTVVGPAVLVEKTARKVLNSNQLDDPQLKREKLTQAFIKRMCRMINASPSLTIAEKNDLLDRPQMLIAISALALAFSSKDEFFQVLVLGDGQKLEKDQIQSLDDQFKDYFLKTCQLKDAIRALGYSEDSLNWEQLMECLDDHSKTKASDWEREGQIKALEALDRKAMELAESIFHDPEFQRLWVIEKSKLERANHNNNNQ